MPVVGEEAEEEEVEEKEEIKASDVAASVWSHDSRQQWAIMNHISFIQTGDKLKPRALSSTATLTSAKPSRSAANGARLTMFLSLFFFLRSVFLGFFFFFVFALE